LLQEIDKLKKLIPDMKILSEIEPKIQDLRKERTAINKVMDGFKEKIDEKEEIIQDLKKSSQNQRNKDQGIIDQADKEQKNIDEHNKNLSSIYAQKDKMREDYY